MSPRLMTLFGIVGIIAYCYFQHIEITTLKRSREFLQSSLRQSETQREYLSIQIKQMHDQVEEAEREKRFNIQQSEMQKKTLEKLLEGDQCINHPVPEPVVDSLQQRIRKINRTSTHFTEFTDALFGE